jgi:hypothetical protein
MNSHNLLRQPERASLLFSLACHASSSVDPPATVGVGA